MSTNPRTKTYAKRVRQLARELSFYASNSPATAPLLLDDERLAGLPRTMRLAVVAGAIEDAEDFVRIYVDRVEAYRRAIERLKALRVSVHRGPLRVVGDDA